MGEASLRVTKTGRSAGLSWLSTDRRAMRGHHDRFRAPVKRAPPPLYLYLENRARKRKLSANYGETRTRTGDTTIFRRAAPALKLVRFAGNSGRFGGRGRVQISLRRAAVSRTLRPTRSLVGLFVSGGDTGRQRARSPTGRYPYRARSSRLRILPDAVRGSASMNASARGSL